MERDNKGGTQLKKQHGKSTRLSPWHFLLYLLDMSDKRHLIEWTNKEQLEFYFVDPSKVAFIWGYLNGKTNMTYQNFARAMRYYYGKGVLEKIARKSFHYRFIRSSKTRLVLDKVSQGTHHSSKGSSTDQTYKLFETMVSFGEIAFFSYKGKSTDAKQKLLMDTQGLSSSTSSIPSEYHSYSLSFNDPNAGSDENSRDEWPFVINQNMAFDNHECKRSSYLSNDDFSFNESLMKSDNFMDVDVDIESEINSAESASDISDLFAIISKENYDQEVSKVGNWNSFTNGTPTQVLLSDRSNNHLLNSSQMETTFAFSHNEPENFTDMDFCCQSYHSENQLTSLPWKVNVSIDDFAEIPDINEHIPIQDINIQNLSPVSCNLEKNNFRHWDPRSILYN